MTRKITNYFSKIGTGVKLNTLVAFFSSFGLGFASLFFVTQGVALFQIMMIWVISPFAAALVALLFNTWHLKRQLIYGLLSFTFMAVSLLFFNDFSFVTYAIFNGFTMGFYCVSMNYLFFQRSTKKRHAKDSTVYFIIGPLLNILLPSLGAFIIDGFGFKILFLIATILSCVPLIYVATIDYDQVFYSEYSEVEKNFSGLRLYIVLDGALHFFQGHFIPVYILLFLKTEYEMGALFSYLAVISLFASFYFSNISDVTQNRMSFLKPVSWLMGIFILMMATIDNVVYLFIIIGAYAFLDNISLPIRFAIPLDMKTKDMGFWRASEVYCNLGRVLAFGLSSISLYLDNYWAPFMLFAFISFIIPFVAESKMKK